MSKYNHNRQSRHYVNANLRNQVISGAAARRLKHDMVEQTVERDPWFQYNMTRLVQAFRDGRVVLHIYKNVGERLQRIAHHRAADRLNLRGV
jgi:hypothetical protein